MNEPINKSTVKTAKGTWDSIVISLRTSEYNTDDEYESDKKKSVISQAYRIFGSHDLLKITRLIPECEEKASFVEGESCKKENLCARDTLWYMWEKTYEYSKNIKPDQSIHNLFATTDDCGDFWTIKENKEEKEKRPYLFMSVIQLNYRYGENFQAQADVFKAELTEYLENDPKQTLIKNKDYSIYLSLDCGDLILFLRSEKYEAGSSIITNFTMQSENLHYTYSVYGMKPELITNNDKISKVVICATLSEPRLYLSWYKELKKAFSGKRTDWWRLGNEDICINIFDCEASDLVKQLDECGILSPKNELMTKCMSRPRIQFDSTFNETNFTSLEKRELIVHESVITNILETELKDVLDYDYPADKPIHKALMEVIQSYAALEKRGFGFDVQDCIRNVFPLFAQKIKNYEYKIDKYGAYQFNADLIYFITGLLSIANGSLHADKLFLNVPGFNAVVCEAPSTLLAYYTTYIQKLVTALNDKKDAEYRFLLCPDLYRTIDVEPLFDYEGDDSQLLKVRVPTGRLFTPRTLLVELTHEAAHYVINKPRNRKFRFKTICRMLADLFSYRLLQPLTLKSSTEIAFLEKFSEKTGKPFSFELLLNTDWAAIPVYIAQYFESGFFYSDDEDAYLLTKIKRHLKEKAFSLFANESNFNNLLNKVFETLLPKPTDRVTRDSTRVLITIIHKRGLDLLYNDYETYIDATCNLCTEAFADTAMLRVLDCPETYLRQVFRNANKRFPKDATGSRDWHKILCNHSLGDRLLVVLNANGYNDFDIYLKAYHQEEHKPGYNDFKEFEKFIKALQEYIYDPLRDGNRFFPYSASTSCIEYLKTCIPELPSPDTSKDIAKLRDMFNGLQEKNLHDALSDFRDCAFEFRKTVIEENGLTT